MLEKSSIEKSSINDLPQHLRSLYQAILRTPPYGWFPSTPALIKCILRLAEIEPGMSVLEPSAGSGVLAKAARDQGAVVDVIELDFRFQQLLVQQGFNLVGSDCLTTEPRRLYDRVIANPPFSASRDRRGVDLDHIQRAFDVFLAPGGRLVSVVSASMNIRNCPKAQEFRRFLRRVNAEQIALPLEVFWGSDRPVTVESWLVVASKR